MRLQTALDTATPKRQLRKNIAAGPDDRRGCDVRCRSVMKYCDWNQKTLENFEAHGLAGKGEGGRGGGAGLVAAFRDYAVEVGIVVVDGVYALADRQCHLADVGRKLLLEVSVADGAVVPLLAEVLYCRGLSMHSGMGLLGSAGPLSVRAFITFLVMVFSSS